MERNDNKVTVTRNGAYLDNTLGQIWIWEKFLTA